MKCQVRGYLRRYLLVQHVLQLLSSLFSLDSQPERNPVALIIVAHQGDNLFRDRGFHRCVEPEVLREGVSLHVCMEVYMGELTYDRNFPCAAVPQ